MNIKDLKNLETPCYVVFTDHAVNIPGDLRSQTNPGHGYPASTEHYIGMRKVTAQELRKLAEDDPTIVAFQITPLTIKAKTQVLNAEGDEI